jgi:very-short-patch-repair endonuclease
MRVDDSGAVGGLVPEDQRVEPFDSLFEQRVHNRLVGRGYTVTPQVDSMGYRIDLVVIGAEHRLAVECDGDYWHGPDQYLRDLARERDLRRCGWKFFRVRESAFYVDEYAALSPLWTMLDELEIRPARTSQVSESAHHLADAESPADNPEPAEATWTMGDVNRTVAGAVMESGPTPDVGTQTLPSYQAYQGWAPPALETSRTNLSLILTDIVTVEGPVLGSRIHSAYVAASGGQRIGRVIAQTLNSVLTSLLRTGTLVTDDPLGQGGIRPSTFRLPDHPLVIQRELGPRDLADVPPLELAVLLRGAAGVTGWQHQEDLFREALRLLGRVRLTPLVQQTLSAVLPLARAEDDHGEAARADRPTT